MTFRGILSTAVSADVGRYASIKLIIIIMISMYIIYNSTNINNIIIVIPLSLFCIFCAVSSYLIGSYPITSCFKIFSFYFTFSSIIFGIYMTRNKFNWLKYMYDWFCILMIISFFLLPFSRFRIVNNNFQGVFNHVNLMAILGALFISIILKVMDLSMENKLFNYILIVMTLIMQYNTFSRTGLLISLGTLFLYLITHTTVKSIVFILLSFFIFISIYEINSDVNLYINTQVTNYIYKGNRKDILSSRRGLQENSKIKYNNNKLFGSGFMMPYKKDYKTYYLVMNENYESGNLVWQLTGDTGIIGTSLFIIFCISILLNGNIKNIFLLFSTFGICMGEAVFFSVNNIAIILYTIISIYIIGDKNRFAR